MSTSFNVVSVVTNTSKPSLACNNDGASSQVVTEQLGCNIRVQNEQIEEMLASNSKNNKISEPRQFNLPLKRLSFKEDERFVALKYHRRISQEGSANKDAKLAMSQGDAFIKPTRKRYFILFMYIVLQLTKSFQWICLASVTNVVAKFYSVDNYAINWTAILFMVTFLILALPCSWLIEFLGLRWSMLIGAIGVTSGLVVKCFSCHRGGFIIGMFGHLIVGITEPFYFSSYSQVASVWFPDHQVAKATSFALIGEELGLALGFIIPPLVIGLKPDDLASVDVHFENDDDDDDDVSMQAVQGGLWLMFFTLTIVSILNTVSLWLFFDEQPKRAPGIARLKQIEATKLADLSCLDAGRSVAFKNFKIQSKQLNEIIRNKNFLNLFIGFGLNVGVAYSIHTLLNQMIMKSWLPITLSSYDITNGLKNSTISMDEHRLHFGDINQIVGNTGLILIVSGLFGSACAGFLLDKHHKYKLTTSLIYLLTFLSMTLVFVYLNLVSQQQRQQQPGSNIAPAWPLYLLTIPLGFALTGYASCGFDYGVEITYPRAELLSSTLLNISAQIFGIPISIIGSNIVDLYGDLALGMFFCSILLIGSLLSCLQGGQLYRQNAVQDDDVGTKSATDQVVATIQL